MVARHSILDVTIAVDVESDYNVDIDGWRKGNFPKGKEWVACIFKRVRLRQDIHIPMKKDQEMTTAGLGF